MLALRRDQRMEQIENQIKSYKGLLVPERNQNMDQVM